MKTLVEKKSDTPDKLLETYFELGLKCEHKALSKVQIKRLYYKWLSKDLDQRTFDQVFEDKMVEHRRFWGEVKEDKLKYFALHL